MVNRLRIKPTHQLIASSYQNAKDSFVTTVADMAIGLTNVDVKNVANVVLDHVENSFAENSVNMDTREMDMDVQSVCV